MCTNYLPIQFDKIETIRLQISGNFDFPDTCTLGDREKQIAYLVILSFIHSLILRTYTLPCPPTQNRNSNTVLGKWGIYIMMRLALAYNGLKGDKSRNLLRNTNCVDKYNIFWRLKA